VNAVALLTTAERVTRTAVVVPAVGAVRMAEPQELLMTDESTTTRGFEALGTMSSPDELNPEIVEFSRCTDRALRMRTPMAAG